MAIKNVGVIGCGLMGSGIVQVAAQAGAQVLFVEASNDLVKRGLDRLRQTMEGLVAKGKLEAAAKDDTLGRIAGTPRLDDLKACDLVIEAMTENQALKNETFAKLDRICAPHALLATNTSSCNVTALAAATTRPRQVLGLHFFNPVPLMKLVEVVSTILVDPAVITAATEWVRAVGKVPVQTKDSTAFIVNRLLVPYLLDAIRAYEGGLATLEDIDQAMKLGCGYPMGPFTLLDLVGLDTTMFVAEVMFEEFREARYAPPPLLKRMVMAGHLGRKTGKGFYTY
ncbi:MAG: 3-hydroxybutyryl-CoA dehydrogenase [Candidatus Rokuibacteriota bacterium]